MPRLPFVMVWSDCQTGRTTMRKRNAKTRTRYRHKPRRFLDAETGPDDEPDCDEPINGGGSQEYSNTEG